MMLEAYEINKSFGDTQVLFNVSVKVNKGDVVAILGPSGSGKTTLLRCLNFLEKADSGLMTFDGESYDMARMSRREILAVRRKTAFVFQNYNLFLNQTVLRNVTLGLTSGQKMGYHEAYERAKEALKRVGMDHRMDAYPRELSGGQQQRVAIARGLAARPDIIFFDEPTSALDPELIGEVLNVMRELADDGMTMLVVTHEMEFARHVSSRVIFMEHGRVLENAPSLEFFEQPRTERSRAFVSSILGQHQMKVTLEKPS